MSQLYFSSKKRNNGSILQIRGHYYANNRNDCFQPIGQLSPISFKSSSYSIMDFRFLRLESTLYNTL